MTDYEIAVVRNAERRALTAERLAYEKEHILNKLQSTLFALDNFNKLPWYTRMYRIVKKQDPLSTLSIRAIKMELQR